ncbi:MAG: phosphoribosylamine--glycine ligase [Chloroflexi bacterium]|nr:phosphoribosylamine--glycine ligase [Chloroflexota bacterium]
MRSPEGQQQKDVRVLLIGGGAREHTIAEALCRGGRTDLLTVSRNDNPGLAALSRKMACHDERDVRWISEWAREQAVDLAVIGLEDPLEVGLPDALDLAGIPTVGPMRQAARLETSKLFTRDLMRKYDIPGQVEYHYFTDPHALRRFLRAADREFALKPVGLTAGKGVKVMGLQLHSVEDAIEYGQAVIQGRIGGAAGVVVEERLIGEEFTLQTFVDGHTVLPMPLVKDYKRAFEGDEGPNTGSMGSYSQADGLLPFVTERQRDEALGILRRVTEGLRSEGCPYRGVMYGQFMMTDEGAKLIEINARFGDPEATNVLPLLENDLVDVCHAIIGGTLEDLDLRFARKATVCKYVTPPGYPLQPRVAVKLGLDRTRIESLGVKVFFAKVNGTDAEVLTTTSRSIALVGVADTVDEAEQSVEQALAYVHGEYHVRRDIGKRHLVERRLDRAAVVASR